MTGLRFSTFFITLRTTATKSVPASLSDLFILLPILAATAAAANTEEGGPGSHGADGALLSLALSRTAALKNSRKP